jgi:hypothetical protein
MQDETGNKYGRLTVLSEAPSIQLKNNKNRRRVTCLCECGKTGVFTLAKLRHGHTQSCGCLALDARTKHGFARKKTSDPLRRKTYIAWSDIKNRCLNQNSANYKNYGARGIKMHTAWVDSFEAFLACVGMCPDGSLSIGRINNNGGYVPGNVRWETDEQQYHNKTNTRFLTHDGTTQSLTRWARSIGVNPNLLTGRLRRGWSEAKTLTTPYKPRKTAAERWAQK